MNAIKFRIVTEKSTTYIRDLLHSTYCLEINQATLFPIFPLRESFIPKDYSVLFFEYKCSFPLWQLSLIISKKYTCSVGTIRQTDTWIPLSIDLHDYSEAIIHNLYYNKENIIFSLIPFPTSPSIHFEIRNIRLRSFTKGEKRRHLKRMEFRERITEQMIDLYSYLHKNDFPCSINSVSATSEKINIHGTVCHEKKEFILCEIPVFAELSPNEFKEICPVIPSPDGAFNVSIQRITDYYGDTYDRMYSRFAVAVKNGNNISIASHGKYVEAIETEYSIPNIISATKKGLGGFKINGFESDLNELGISHITVNFRINNFLRLTPSKETFPFDYHGKIYYADRKKIEQYDKALLAAAERGIIVSAIILVYPAEWSKDKEVGYQMEHPEYDSAGAYTMPDLTSLKSVNLYAAALDFLAARYSRQDCKYGHIQRWIVHNEVDSAWIWCNVGKKTVLEMMSIYVKSLRMVHLTALKYNAAAMTFISLTHYWKGVFAEHCFSSHIVIETLKSFCKVEGDFGWGIAYHPYPETLWEPKSWLDKNATNSEDTKLITFKNIEVLCSWISRPENLFHGKRRVLMLAEQNPHSVDYSEKALSEQAASLAYILRKVQRLEAIDCYIAHSWIDSHFEGGIKTGLRKYYDDPYDPYGKKPSWFVMKAVGTSAEKKVFEDADRIIEETTKYEFNV